MSGDAAGRSACATLDGHYRARRFPDDGVSVGRIDIIGDGREGVAETGLTSARRKFLEGGVAQVRAGEGGEEGEKQSELCTHAHIYRGGQSKESKLIVTLIYVRSE